MTAARAAAWYSLGAALVLVPCLVLFVLLAADEPTGWIIVAGLAVYMLDCLYTGIHGLLVGYIPAIAKRHFKEKDAELVKAAKREEAR